MISQSIPPRTQKPAPPSNTPMLIKASLKNHSPQEIYDYLFKNIGQLGLKIKKRQAIIGFQNQHYYDKLLRDHKVVMLHGRKLQFIPLPQADENYIESQKQQVIQVEQPTSSISSKYQIPEFKCKNLIEAIANRYRYDLHTKVEQHFSKNISSIRQRGQQLKLQIKDEGPRQRQLKALQALIENKLKDIETKYEADLTRLNKSIQEFSMRANNIDVQPTFVFEDNWKFPQINEKNMRFEQASFYKNPDSQFSCKRLCAINGSQFAVTMSNHKYQGKVRLYDVKNSDAKKTMEADPGVYGICRVNKYLIIGAIDSTLRYVDLSDTELQLNNTRRLMDNAIVSIFQIKIFRHSEDRPEILTLGTDNMIRRYELTIDEICEGVKDLSFDQKQAIATQQNCCTFEIVNPNVILFGRDLTIRKYQMERKIFRDIKVNSKPIRIKKFNQNLHAVASNNVVELVDMRTQTVVQKFLHMPKQLRSLQIVGQHSLMYGALCQIGLLDDRKHEVFPWKSVAHHKDIVYDILKLQNTVVSCDKKGHIYGWKLAEGNSEPIEI